MALYTTQLRSIVEQCQAEAHVGPDDFTVAYARLGLNDYPIFDESYRQTLNDKIIRHYYLCEIGDETVARFRWHLRSTMSEQMPYFNQLYESLNLITDPLTNVHYTYSEAIAENVSEEGSESRSGTVNRDVDVTETHSGDDVTEAAKGTTTTEELEHGKTETETLQHGHVVDDSQVTNYGRTQATVNGGSDQTLDGKTSEREIKSDTPMNQISQGGVEALNYATEVTYTDREGTRAGTTTYGGTTDVTYGGADSTTDRTVNSGTDTTTTGTTGTDTSTTTVDGADTTTLTHGEVVTTVTNDDTATTSTGTDSRATDRDLTRDRERMGYDGISQSRLLEEFRKTFLNVDLRVIESVSKCFFGLWM